MSRLKFYLLIAKQVLSRNNQSVRKGVFHEAAIIDSSDKVIVKRIRFANSHSWTQLGNSTRPQNSVWKQPGITGWRFTLICAKPGRLFTLSNLCSPTPCAFIRQTKNDTIDALIVAEVIRFGRYSQVAPENIVALRELCRQRFFVVDMASDFKRKIIALLNQTFPEYEKLFSDTFGKSSMELLANYTTPEEMLLVDTQKLADLLSKTSCARFGLDKANQIQQTAKNSFGIVYRGFRL